MIKSLLHREEPLYALRINILSSLPGFLAGYIEKQDFMYALKMGLSAGSASAFSENLATKEEILNVFKTI